MRVRTTFRARRHLRSVVITGLMSGYYDDAYLRLSTAPDDTDTTGIVSAGPTMPDDSVAAGWSASDVGGVVP